MSNIKFTMKDLDGTVMPYTSFVISTSASANAASFTTNLNGQATVSLNAVSTPYYISKQDGTTESVIAYKFFVPESVIELEAEMLFVDMGKISTDKDTKSIAALIEAKVVAVNARNEAFKLAQILGVIDNIENSLENVTRVRTSIDNVDRVFSSIANVDRVFTSIDKLDRVHTSISKLDRVHASIDNVDVVYTNISNIDTVSSNITNVNKTAAIDTNVTKVANIDTNVTKVANIDTNITKVANVDTAVTKVANIDDDVVLLNTVVISYLGTSSSTPSTRIGGASIQIGDWYIDSSVTPHQIKVCSAINSGTASFVFVKNMDAEAAKVAAEAARDAAIIGAGVYATESDGRAAVADGVAFKVQGSGDVAAYEYRRTNSTTSVLIAIYPSASSVARLPSDLGAAGERIYKGTGPMFPIVADQNGAVVLGYSSNNDAIEATQFRSVGDKSRADYVGSSSVYPVLTDANLRVLLGYDSVAGTLVGDFPSARPNITASVALTQPPIAKAVNHMLFYGQSLSVGAQGTPVLSTSQPYNNITFNGGPRAWTGSAFDFTAFKPLVEDQVSPAPDGGTTRGETPCSGAANYASNLAAISGTNPQDHVILTSTGGYGGATIASLAKGGARYNTYFKPHITAGKALNADYALHAFCWMQGENDAVTGTQTPYATYRAALEQMQVDVETDAQAISGQSSPVYCVTYQLSYAAATWPQVALAQLDLAQKNSKFALATPMYHVPYASDNIHLSALGYKIVGAYFGRAYKQLVIDKVKPQWLNPISATRKGAVIRVRFSAPRLPLVLDTTTLAVTTNHGFKVLDGVSTATISGIQVDASDVVITLSSVPSGAVTVRYGLDYLGAGLTFTGGASGNLRDSTPDVISIAGTSYPLFHVCPHFSLSAVNLSE